MMGDILRRVRNALAFGHTLGPVTIADGNVPQVQVQLTPLEIMVLRLVEQRGVASNMPIGTPVLALFQSGDRSNGIITGSAAPKTRPTLSGPEDTALYGYGWSVTIKADGIHIVAPDIWINGNLHVTGSIDGTGNFSSTGEIVAKSGLGGVTLSNHRHAGGPAPSLGT